MPRRYALHRAANGVPHDLWRTRHALVLLFAISFPSFGIVFPAGFPYKGTRDSEMQYAIERPGIVERALRLADELSFAVRPEGNSPPSVAAGPSCCLDEMGMLLQTLAASVDCGLVGEIGTGAGVGTAWLASGLRPTSRLLTVEIEPRLASGARNLFRDRGNIQVLTGDWRAEFSSSKPFDLLFADGGGVDKLPAEKWSIFADMLRPGGIVAMDDLTPEDSWPASWKGKPDPKRELAFRSGLFVAAELRLRPHVSALIMSRK